MSVFYRGEGQGRERGCTTLRLHLFYKPLECLFWTLPTPADKVEEVSLSNYIIFLQENSGDTSSISNDPYLWPLYVTTGESPAHHSKSE